MVRCRGCSECALREEELYFNEWEARNLTAVRYKPPRLWRRSPDWLPSLEGMDEVLHDLLGEVYSAVNDEQTRLLSMGVRTALDHVMTKILGADLGNFQQKLDEMVKRRHLTPTQRTNLDIVIEAGSASSHRGFQPRRELLEEMVGVMEGIIREHYITGPMLDTARTLIPPRPSRRR